MALEKDAVSATRKEAQETGVKDGLEKGGDGEPGELLSGPAKDV